MLPSKPKKAFDAFYNTVRDETILDRKTTAIVGLAAAMAAGCSP
ncbi:hypothetical protein [Desulfuromonas sp.]|nr:hypothetical protein [Desulfuromonas sp.]